MEDIKDHFEPVTRARVASSEFQSIATNLHRWKEEDFRVVKIERLRADIRSQSSSVDETEDLEKAENAYLSSFTSKKSKTLPGATAAAHGDPNGKNDYQKKGGKFAPHSNDCGLQVDCKWKELQSRVPSELGLNSDNFHNKFEFRKTFNFHRFNLLQPIYTVNLFVTPGLEITIR
ncbi:hypothetical protein TNCV_3500551 [Trichonephila clavipes]|nr:hypothetical protein TNCV_3500551 [Trichonephila clavipes]